MKKLIGYIFIFLAIFSFRAKAQDGFFTDALSEDPGQFSFGIQPIIYTQLSNDEFMVLFRGRYEFQTGLKFDGKIGLLREDTYFGGHVTYPLASEPYNPISVAAVGGVYHFGEFGIKLGTILSKKVGDFSIYSGLTFEPLFTDLELLPLLIPFGVEIPLGSDQADFLFEVDLGLNEDSEPYEAFHFGINVYFYDR